MNWKAPLIAEEHAARVERACFRLAVEDGIERLIAILDELDGDADLEPDDCFEEWIQPASLRGGTRAAA